MSRSFISSVILLFDGWTSRPIKRDDVISVGQNKVLLPCNTLIFIPHRPASSPHLHLRKVKKKTVNAHNRLIHRSFRFGTAALSPPKKRRMKSKWRSEKDRK